MASGATAPLEPTGTSDRLRTSVQLLFVCVFLIIAAVLAASLVLRRSDALDVGKRRAENLAFILSDHLTRTVSGIDTTLSQLALVGSRVGGSNTGDEAWGTVLEAAKSGVSGIAILAVLDTTGTIRRSTLPQLVGQSRADTFLFRRLSTDPGAGLVADTPLRGRLSGQWVIPFGRRLHDRDGQFAGLVVATLEPERLRTFYRTIDVGSAGFIAVLNPDKSVLFREPSSEDRTGQSVQDNPLLARQKDSPASGFVRSSFVPGGPVYLSAYRTLRDPPLFIAVSLAESDLLAAWWTGAIVSAAIAAGFGVLLVIAWRMVMREIRKRAEADAALRTNQAQFQSVMDHAPMMVSLKDRQGRYTFTNRTFRDFIGHSVEALRGKTVADFTPDEYADLIAREDRNAIESRRVVQREVKLPGENDERTALLVKFPVFDGRGEVTGVGTVMADITEQKKIELHLAQAQRIDAVGQLTGGIAHDFNNLLTTILLNADVLASALDDRLRPLAESVRMAAERGADLTRRLLAFGRRQMLEPRPTDVQVLLAGMEPLMHRTLGEHIEIKAEHNAELWFATVDPAQLENAVLNLALNARDAMPSGGRLTIETANVEFNEEQAAASPESKPGHYVMIAVRDTGCGMPPGVLARAFEPFFTTKDVGKGTGLGLSMVYGFVKQSGGHVRIQSDVGTGTVVQLYLPRSLMAAVAADAAPLAPQDLPAGKETILFVEDDPLVRQHTGRQIAALGYAIIAAENANEALALVEDGCVPDLLFTDVVMPGGMNGRQLALKLRQRWPRLRVLYTSGYAHGQLEIDGESVPSKYVLGKPYRRIDLAAKLREVLDESASA